MLSNVKNIVGKCFKWVLKMPRPILPGIGVFLISVISIWLYHVWFHPQSVQVVVVDVNKIVGHELNRVVKQQISVAQKNEHMLQFSNQLVKDLQGFGAVNKVLIFAKGALISNAEDITQGYINATSK